MSSCDWNGLNREMRVGEGSSVVYHQVDDLQGRLRYYSTVKIGDGHFLEFEHEAEPGTAEATPFESVIFHRFMDSLAERIVKHRRRTGEL